VRVLEPLNLRDRVAPNRVLFGPHETNLGFGRGISERHLAYYERRAAGGAGLVVCEEASVHDSDWPYERCPLAQECGPGWTAFASRVQALGSLAIAAIGHTGGQGSSAYSQLPLWAPSGIPEVNTREMPKSMEIEDIDAVVRGFGDAAERAMRSGLDGVEVNAGQNSLIRQFLSGLTNVRDDDYGSDRMRFAREVLHAVRVGAGNGIVGLRLSCDELAPWAGIVPEAAADIAEALSPWIDYLVVVRGGIFSVGATRPDGHDEPGFNLDLVGAIRASVNERVAVFGQGSIVDIGQAEWAIGDGRCDGVEMTRAQIADAAMMNKVANGQADQIRPCILCNQTCKVRDARNPIISCVVDPRSGHELDDADPEPSGASSSSEPTGADVMIIGGGVAGLECARVAAGRGHRVEIRERSSELGGMVVTAAQGAGRARLLHFVEWLAGECERLNVNIKLGIDVGIDAIATAESAGCSIVFCTGGRRGDATYDVAAGSTVLSADEFLAGGRDQLRTAPVAASESADPVVIWDPIGGPIAVSIAEQVAHSEAASVTIVTPDLIVGTLLSRSGDLAPANVRLAGAGVHVVKNAILREVRAGGVIVEDRFTGETNELPCGLVIDAGPMLPNDELWNAVGVRHGRAGDNVAPRTVYEAVLEARRVALAIDAEGTL